MYMRSGPVVLPEDYDLLRNYRSLRAARGPPSRSDWQNCLRVDFKIFSALPQLLAEVPLPPGLEYPPPLILRYFPKLDTFFKGLDSAEKACIDNRYQRALQAVLALMIRISLAADFNWTHR